MEPEWGRDGGEEGKPSVRKGVGVGGWGRALLLMPKLLLAFGPGVWAWEVRH